MKELLLLFGGQSSEHTVSCNSVASMMPYIDRNIFNVTVVGITRDGEWLLTKATPDEIVSGDWEKRCDNKEAFLSPNRTMKGLQVIDNGVIRAIPIDVVFPVMHGENCEDGVLQGLLEMCGIPYVGPGVCASACSMDKTVTKKVSESANVRQARYAVVTANELAEDSIAAAIRTEEIIGNGYPLFVKPASAGSSVGVSKVNDRNELIEAFYKAAKVCQKIIIEEMIIGREIEVAVIGNSNPEASCVGEILSANDFYDFNAKYENAASRTIIPADISADVSKKIRDSAIKIYSTMDCSVMSRVDFFLLANGDIVFNEINTLPGFTKISMFPKLWEHCGVSYSELITKLCEFAVSRGHKSM